MCYWKQSEQPIEKLLFFVKLYNTYKGLRIFIKYYWYSLVKQELKEHKIAFFKAVIDWNDFLFGQLSIDRIDVAM